MAPGWNNYAPVALEGLKYIFLALFCLGASILTFDSFLIHFVFFVVFCYMVYFFRNPERLVPLDPLAVVSPADGKVIVAESISSDPKNPKFKIGIFLSVFDVHINRIPISGTVRRVVYRPGTFGLAFRPKESEENERNEIVLQDDSGHRLTIVQIAGYIARRIVCYVKEGNFVNAGDRFGMIQFGSRVDLIIEGTIDVFVEPGTRVKGGQTILAKYKAS